MLVKVLPKRWKYARVEIRAYIKARSRIGCSLKQIFGDTRRMVDIPISRVHHILKDICNVRKISAWWVPHLLTDGQKKQN